MRKPKDYDTTQINEFEQLPSGGYICKIIGVKEKKSQNGNDMIVVAVDIAEGEYKGYFQQKFDASNKPDKKWPNSATSYILIENQYGGTNERFKKFVTYTEISNKFFVDWSSDWSQFKGKLIGATFRREQFEGDNGLAFTTKIAWFNTTEQIRHGVKAPEDKLLKQTNTKQAAEEDDDDLPF